jgi:hypothetical protein
MGICAGKWYAGGKKLFSAPGTKSKQSNITAIKTDSYNLEDEKDARNTVTKQVRSRSGRFRINREARPSVHPSPFAAKVINGYRNNCKQEVTGNVGYKRRKIIWPGTIATSHWTNL